MQRLSDRTLAWALCELAAAGLYGRQSYMCSIGSTAVPKVLMSGIY